MIIIKDIKIYLIINMKKLLSTERVAGKLCAVRDEFFTSFKVNLIRGIMCGAANDVSSSTLI